MPLDSLPETVQAQRADTERRLNGAAFDLLVVGGGISGAAVARDSAMRGLATALVEQQDFASGTSSRSSRLLHGGIRYLAQGRIGLVREASREKIILGRIAPHLAQPLAFVFPTFKGGHWPLWKLRAGVKIYDWLCGSGNFGRSSALDSAAVRVHLPGLRTEGLTGAVRYFDGFTNDSRLTIDTLRSAARHGAHIRNYTCLENAEPSAGGWRCQLKDRLSGEKMELHARCVINASGPWARGFKFSSVALRLTKGVHLVVERSRLPISDAVVMTEGARILFAIPWGERTILGTTDTDYSGPLESPNVEAADTRYILDVTNASFPGARLEEQDIRSAWAGLRPLVAAARGGPSDISRSHVIRMPHPGWFDLAGGKLTTARLMGEQTVDAAAKYLKLMPRVCRTAEEPLLTGGGAPHSSTIPPPLNQETVAQCVRSEWAVGVEDIMWRRTSWQHYLPQPLAAARQVEAWMAGSNAESTPRVAR